MNLKSLALLLLAAPVLSFSQSEFTFTSKAELVQVPTVISRDGKPLTGLTAKDFQLFCDGKPQTISVFEEVDAVPAKVQPEALPPHTVQNFAAANAHQDVVILVLDLLNGSWTTSSRIRAYIGDMAQALRSSNTPVAVFLFTRNGLVQMHSFTSSPEDLTKAIDRWIGNARLDEQPLSPQIPRWSSALASMDTSESADVLRQFAIRSELSNARNIDQVAMMSDAVEQIAQGFRGIPGRKKMIWVSTGFLIGSTRLRYAANPNNGGTTFGVGTPTDFLADFQIGDKRSRAWKALSDANIAVYPIDSNGAENASWNERFAADRGGDRLNSVAPPTSVTLASDTASLREVAQKTGGLACTDLLPACVKKAQSDANHYYVLGFYLNGNNKPGWHKIQVKVDQSGTSTRTREGFLTIPARVAAIDPKSKAKDAKRVEDAAKEQAAMDKASVITALASPLDYTAVPLRLSWTRSAKGSGIDLTLISPPGGLSFEPETLVFSVDLLAFVRPVGEADGRSYPDSLIAKMTAAQAEGFARNGFLYRKNVPLTTGRYEVRFLARDNTSGKMGTVSTMVEVP
jgi:VWFA-related protein